MVKTSVCAKCIPSWDSQRWALIECSDKVLPERFRFSATFHVFHRYGGYAGIRWDALLAKGLTTSRNTLMLPKFGAFYKGGTPGKFGRNCFVLEQ